MKSLWLVAALLSIASLAHADTRHVATVRAFKKLTGYPHGRPGMIADHVIPLCAGGADSVTNMRWQSITDAKIKDRYERALCRALKVQGYRLVKVVP